MQHRSSTTSSEATDALNASRPFEVNGCSDSPPDSDELDAGNRDEEETVLPATADATLCVMLADGELDNERLRDAWAELDCVNRGDGTADAESLNVTERLAEADSEGVDHALGELDALAEGDPVGDSVER